MQHAKRNTGSDRQASMSLGTVGEAFTSEVTFGKACIPGHRYIARLKTM